MVRNTRDEGRCPWLDRVQEYLDDLLPIDQEQSFVHHLRECPACRAEIESLRDLQRELHMAAEQPLPGLDKAAVAARLFDRPAPRTHRWLVPAAALGAAAAAVFLFVFVLWPSQREALTHEAPNPGPVVADLQPAGPAVVTYMAGRVLGPVETENGWTLPIGVEARVVGRGALAIRLDEHTSLAVFRSSRVRVESEAGFTVRLEEGSLAARLRKGHRHSFQVRCDDLQIEATGTAFAVFRIGRNQAEIVLAEGTLALTGTETFELRAPSRARFVPDGLREVGDLRGLERNPLDLAAIYDPVSDGPLGTLALSCAPVEAAVLVDGIMVGNTPLVLARPAGELHLEIRADDYRPVRTSLVLDPDRLVKRHFDLAPGPVAPPPRPRKDLLAEARKLLAARKVEPAKGLLRRHLEKNPGDARGLFLLADARRIAGQAGRALDTYLEVASRTDDERLAEAALYQAGLLQLHSLNRPAKALTTFETVRRKHPRGLLRQEVAFHLAECYLAFKDFRRALRALQDYLRLYPDGTKASEARALLDALHQKGWR